MKIDEAIQIIKDIYPSKSQIGLGEYDHVAETFDMAIEALETIARGYVPGGFMPIGYHDKVYSELQKRYFDLLERTRWIPVSERLPTKKDANSKGKITAWCTSFNGTEVDLNWRLIEKDGVITHWRIGIEPPEQEV